MGRMLCAATTVVDLYAGIGYYTLPLLVCGGAAKVGSRKEGGRAARFGG